MALQPEEILEEGEDGELYKLVEHMFERDPEDYPELEPELQRQLEQVRSLQQEIAHWPVDARRLHQRDVGREGSDDSGAAQGWLLPRPRHVHTG